MELRLIFRTLSRALTVLSIMAAWDMVSESSELTHQALAQTTGPVAQGGQPSQVSLANPGVVTAIASGPNWPVDGLITAALSDRLARTTDGGKTWDHLGAPEAVLSLTLAPSLAGNPITFALAGQNLYRSIDLGANWTSVGPRPYVLTISPDFARDQLVFKVKGGALARSIDGGLTWGSVPLGEGWLAQELVFSQSYAAGHKIFVTTTDATGALFTRVDYWWDDLLAFLHQKLG